VTTPFAGAVLCGGSSTRMGRDKALVTIDGAALARRVTDALVAAGATAVVAVGGDTDRLTALGLRVVPDRWPGEGPLGGVVTALDALASAPVVVVLACDLLDPDPAAIVAVAAAASAPGVDLAAPRDEGRLQLHHAAWRPGAAVGLRAELEAGERALWRAVRQLHAVGLDAIPRTAYRDADVPADLAEARRGSPSAGPPRYAPSGPDKEDDLVEVPEIDVEELDERRARGATVIDVREPDEYAEAHIPGAVLVPLATVPDNLAEFPTTGPVYIVCRSGARSRRAAAFLRSSGVDAVNVAGGLRSWLEAGKPHDSGAADADR
jgi:molybdenum cofactor guanylyltransferase